MERMSALLRLGSRVRFRDRWTGRLFALEVDDEWRVLNVVVKRGLVRAQTVKLPFSAATDWSGEHVSFDCTTGQAFRREIPPVGAPARMLWARTALSAPGVRLVGALVDRTERRVTHLLLRRGRAPSGGRKAAVGQVALDVGRLELTVQFPALALYRSDEELQRLVREALEVHPYLTADDRRALTVEAADGVVSLGGNIRSPQAKKWAGEAASSIEGALVENEIVDDQRLEQDVARALNRAEPLLGARVYVRSSLGDVTLSG